MNIIKSLHASLLHRTFSHQGRHYFTVSVLWGFDLNTGQAQLEQSLWKNIGELLGNNELFDTGMPKPNAEFLLHGHCCAPQGQQVKAQQVRVGLGEISKELSVFGDRHWLKGLGVWGLSEPKPFSEMPISYQHAFGGKKDNDNPLGIGIDEQDSELGPLQALPNIEYPQQLISAPSDTPVAASFNRLDSMSQQRLKYGGTYDQHYIQTRMPGLPDDFDYRFFNDAPADQQISGYFQGDERFSIENMHPQQPIINGQLPNVTARIFVDHQCQDERVFKELAVNLDTVWFFPMQQLGVLIHRGSIEVAEDDACDIKQLLIANESSFQKPRSVEHYQQQLRLRTDPEHAYKYLMSTQALLPEGVQCGFASLQDNTDLGFESATHSNLEQFVNNKQAQVQQQTSEQFAQLQSKTPADSPQQQQLIALEQQLQQAHHQPADLSDDMQIIADLSKKILPTQAGDPKKVDLSQLDLQAVDELNAHMQNLEQQKKAEAKQQLLDQIQQLNHASYDTSKQQLQLENMIVAMDLPPVLPRLDSQALTEQLQQQQQALQQQLLTMHSMGASAQQLLSLQQAAEKIAKQPPPSKALQQAKDSYRLAAHHIEQARSPHQGQEPRILADLLAAINTGSHIKHTDFAFVDCSSLQLHKLELSAAYFEYANLSACQISHCNLSEAIFCHAKLKDTQFISCNLQQANFGALELTHCQFIDCDLTAATFSKSYIKDCEFKQCTMTKNQEMFLQSQFSHSQFIDSDMTESILIDADISHCDFSGSNLSQSHFVNPIMQHACFKGCNLSTANFVAAQADFATFEHGLLKNVRFVAESSLASACFNHADMQESNLRDCQLSHAQFMQAQLDKTDFSGANLQHSNFSQAIACQCQFMKSDLTAANMKKINLFQGSLYKARLSSANFTEASLYAVNFLDCTLGQTDFLAADLTQTILQDWRPS